MRRRITQVTQPPIFSGAVDEATGQVTSVVDLSGSVRRVNNALLSVPPRTLPYGLYRFTLRVSMGVMRLFDVEQSTYVRVIKTPIIATIVNPYYYYYYYNYYYNNYYY